MNPRHRCVLDPSFLTRLLLLGLAVNGLPAQEPQALRAAATAFLRNDGQWADDVLFAARSRSAQLGVARDGIRLRLAGKDGGAPVPLSFRFARACGEIEGEGASPTRFAVLGGDAARWRSGIAAFAGLRCRDIAPGVDLRLRPSDDAFEYDLVLAPGADASALVLRVDTALGLSIEDDGRLRIDTQAGPLHQSIPATFSEAPDGTRTPVACRFRVLGPDSFGFELGAHDADRAVVIDPVLAWSTYFGGAGEDAVRAVASDPVSGDLIAVGSANTGVWPALPSGGAQPSYGGGVLDTFVARFAAGSGALLAFTYLGGTANDFANDVAIDGAGAVYVTGFTASFDFPTLTPVQGGLLGTNDAYVTKLDPMLGTIAWSTYLGGSLNDIANSIAVSAMGEAVVVGTTPSTDFPTLAPAQAGLAGSIDVFVARFAASGTSLIHATYLGGSAGEGVPCVAITATGDAVVCGSTTSADFPVYRAFDPTKGGVYDGFVARYTATGLRSWASFLGGSADESARGIAMHPSGEILVGGHTSSTDFPIVGSAFQSTRAGGNDFYVARITGTGSAITASTYFGGTGGHNFSDLDVGPGGIVLISGETWSTDLPLTRGTLQTTNSGGSTDRVLAVLDHGLSALVFSTYFGGSSFEGGTGLAQIAGTGAFGIALAGYSESSDLTTSAGAWSRSLDGVTDGFIANLTPQDWGDLPDLGMVCGGVSRAYLTVEASDGPHYDEVGLQRLGLFAGLESDGQPSCAADGDDLAPGADDEDGVVFGPTGVAVTVQSWRTGTVAYRIDAWFDVDDDGTFDEATEHLITSTAGGPGAVSVSRSSATTTPTLVTFAYPLRPLGRDPREFYSRFRLTYDVPSTTPILHFGEYSATSDGNSHGEVEDYAPGASLPPCHQLTTTFGGTSSLASGAVLYFDLDAQLPLTIQGLELHLGGTNLGQIEIYTCSGTRTGKQTTPSAWSLASRGAVAPAGSGQPNLVTISPFSIPAGITGIALRPIGVVHRYNSGAGNYSTPELTLRSGEWTSGLFSGSFGTNRTVNCRFCYAPAGTPWAGRETIGNGCPAAGSSTCYQFFRADTFDLGTPDNSTQRSIRMSLSGNGYRLAPGSNQWHVPTTGDLGLGDDGVSAPLPLPWQFPFPLGSTNSLRVSANGVVWPTAQADGDYSPSVTELLNGAPRYCLFWADLVTASAAPVTAEPVGGSAAFVITYDRARMYVNPSGSVTAQIVFFPNGDVEMRWRSCMRDPGVLVGWSRGGGSANPGGLDLSALPPSGYTTGQDGTPLTLDALSRPVIGTNCVLETRGIPSTALFAGLLLGLHHFDPGIDLSLLGMPGCRQFTLGIQGYGLAVPGPISTLTLPIPNDAGLIGLPLIAQSIAHGPFVNPFGLITSNGLRLTIGN